MATHCSPALPRDLRFEPTPKRIRAVAGAATIADTTRALLIWEPDHVVPTYAIPDADVNDALLHADADLRAGDHAAPLAAAWSLDAGGRLREHAAWRYDDPQLAGHVALHWAALDAWYEEDERVLGHPRDPFHRVDARRASRHVRVEWEGRVLAESRRPTLVFETGLPVRHYLPREDVRMEWLEPIDRQTICAYKGVASHLSVRVGAATGEDLAWSYPEPLADNLQLRGLIAFLAERLDVIEDGRRLERPLTQWS